MRGMALRRYAVVVDPVGTGQEYPVAFRAAGVSTVAVLSTPSTLDDPYYVNSWHPANFEHIHVFDTDLDGLAATVRDYRPVCVIPGAETGVELADALAELVAPGTGNVPELAAARRHKGAMAQAVERAGIPHLRQICSADPDEVDRWLADAGLASSPLVVKPPKSSGTDNVHLVAAGSDWRPYFDQIYGRINELGLRNNAVVVQEYAEGTEYMINSYSVDGRHGLTDVCRYTKSRRGDRIGVYDLVDFLPSDHPEVGAVWPYAQRVLDAVGIRSGCAHTEVILTVAGPRFIEVGARQAGGGHMMIAKLATGSNQVLRTVAHRVHGEFNGSYELIQHVCSVVVSSPHAGIWRNADIFAGVDSLPTFWTKHFYFADGDHVPAPGGMTSFLGWVVLASSDRALLETDYRRIKELERQIRVEIDGVLGGLPVPSRGLLRSGNGQRAGGWEAEHD
jgi:ATP-grasp domain